MPGVKQLILGSAAAAALMCACVEPAAAGGHGYGHPPGRGLGRGLADAVVALATLPIAIASAAISAAAPPVAYQAPAYAGGPYGYAPPQAYYAPPPVAYAPPPVYYAPAPVYYPAPRVYYAPRPAYFGGYGGYRAPSLGFMPQPAPVKPIRRGGRPSRADALRLRDQILIAATELFLQEGYGSTTIEAVAARAGVSKRTFYDRFDDKAALFGAVVHRIIDEIRPPPDVPLLAGATLRAVLERLAGLILQAALSPQALALHRLVNAESMRFPELVSAVAGEGGSREATALIEGLLEREIPGFKLDAARRAFTAEQFIFMVVAVPQRRAMGFGVPMTPAELDEWTRRVVDLFLNGCCHSGL